LSIGVGRPPGRSYRRLLQFEALITTARLSTNINDFALLALLVLGLRIFEARGSSVADLGEEHGHRVLRVRDEGGKVALVPFPAAIARAIGRTGAEAQPWCGRTKRSKRQWGSAEAENAQLRRRACQLEEELDILR
jgi:hypothetical protein